VRHEGLGKWVESKQLNLFETSGFITRNGSSVLLNMRCRSEYKPHVQYETVPREETGFEDKILIVSKVQVQPPRRTVQTTPSHSSKSLKKDVLQPFRKKLSHYFKEGSIRYSQKQDRPPDRPEPPEKPEKAEKVERDRLLKEQRMLRNTIRTTVEGLQFVQSYAYIVLDSN
jgi:hypothetical protein